ncbi:hypothetical protein H0O01_03890 [Candidatus Micrarchaeota archaeon]|nr:hypothetical protein [Candidatus Micrarchaeota archaeon]
MAVGWQVLSVIIVLLSFSLSAVMIMLSRVFSNKGLEQWAKAEMVFAISTFLLVIFFYELFTMGQDITISVMREMIKSNYAHEGVVLSDSDFNRMFPLGNDNTTMRLAMLYMGDTYDCLRLIGKTTYAISAPFFFGESFTKDAFMTDATSGWGLKPVTQTAMNIVNYTVFTAFLFLVFRHILEFVSVTALPIFFPIGILLRAFPPTRGSGAYVLAFVVGFYFVFPAAYLLAVNLSMNPFVCGAPEYVPRLPNMCNIAMSGQAEKVLLWANGNAQDTMGFFQELQDKVAGAVINLCCLPFIAMVITMSFILASTNLLGANLPEVGRGFIKLI